MEETFDFDYISRVLMQFLIMSGICIGVFYGIAWLDSWYENKKRK